MKKTLINKFVLLLTLFVWLINAAVGQGLQETYLTTNPTLTSAHKQFKMQQALQYASVSDTIELDTIHGILDDFSNDGFYPDTSLWLDNYVYINRGYAIAPVSIGVATFDGLDQYGYPYNFLALPTSSAPADSLTSKPINLLNYMHNGAVTNYQLHDSLYFSFYYQPQGIGNSPQPSDSLILEFTAPGFLGWEQVWGIPGRPLANNDSSWNLVMIPINNILYLKKGFQFRFRNNATVCGNLDHWHIDYVYLNKYRTITDTLFEDIAFVYETPSLLNVYTSMPWKHYTPSFMKTTYTDVLRNNYSAQKNASFNYYIFDQTGTQVSNYSGGSDNMGPYFPGANYASVFTNPPVSYAIPTLTDTTTYTIASTIYTNPDKHRANDTVRHHQKFYNYYAYDDGTAETAFYLNTLNAQLAEKFVSTIADTLKCIDMYFNPVVTDASQLAFSLNVWNDAGGVPGTALYTSDSVKFPQYSRTGENQFIHYYLDPPLALPAGAFYVGFTQKTTDHLNIGVDKNIDSKSNVFYNVSGSWQTNSIPGTVMMRPVFGVADFHLGIDENSFVAKRTNGLIVYPNPATDKLYISLKSVVETEKVTCVITDMFGRKILEQKMETSESIDISNLSSGVYFINVSQNNQQLTTKFIKSN